MDKSIMKKLILALALLFAPSLAWGQCNGVFGAGQVCGSTTGGIPGPISLPIIIPAAYGIKCDGVTDDTTAFQTMAAAINASGGAADVPFPVGVTCLVYNTGQSITTPLISLNTGSIKSARFHFNGTTLQVGHTFVGSESLAIFNLIGGSNISVDGVNVTQTTPISTCSTPHGSVLISSTGGTSGILLTNSSITGGQAPFQLATVTNVTIINVSSTNSCYGVVGLDGLIGLTVRDFHASGLTRDIFLKGVTDADISVNSINPVSNSVLLSADVNSAILENIRINYKVFPRTAASSSPASYVTVGPTTSITGTIYRNFNINIDIDMSGDTAGISPAVKFIKNTTSSLSTVFENLTFTGRVSGVPNYVGSNPVFDLFTAADASWSGETATNISIENMLVTGSTNPVFFVDYNPFITNPNGAFSLRNVRFPGNYTDANNTNIVGQRLEINSSFANHQGAMNPSFGGTGVFQPTAHTVPIGEGAAVFAFVGPGTTGQVLRGQTGADPIFGQASLTTDVTAILPVANGGTGVGTPTVVGSLPTCNAGLQGGRAFVTDQNTAIAYHGAVTGGGANKQGVTCDGSAWYQD